MRVHTHTHTHGYLTNSKGITLIALIITIIVMLILAGVTISTLISDDGIIEKAESAGTAQKNAELQDKADLAALSIKTDLLSSGDKFETDDNASGDDTITDNNVICNYLETHGYTPYGELIGEYEGKNYVLFAKMGNEDGTINEEFVEEATQVGETGMECVFKITCKDENENEYIAKVRVYFPDFASNEYYIIKNIEIKLNNE